MLSTNQFSQVDVFHSGGLSGNALAVVHGADAWSEGQMRSFANWTNLAETTFLLEPTTEGKAAGADYRVRIFTTVEELPFAGHPTLGSCFAWLQAGGNPQHPGLIKQECAKGIIDIQPVAGQPTRLQFAAPSSVRTPVDEALILQLSQAIGVARENVLAAQLLNNGPAFTALWLTDAKLIQGIKPNYFALEKLGVKLGVAAPFAPADKQDADIEVRVFIPGEGQPEDPVTGSFNASLAQWLIAEKRQAQSYTAAQGAALGRAGRVFISQDESGQIWVGGDSKMVITGQCAV